MDKYCGLFFGYQFMDFLLSGWSVMQAVFLRFPFLNQDWIIQHTFFKDLWRCMRRICTIVLCMFAWKATEIEFKAHVIRWLSIGRQACYDVLTVHISVCTRACAGIRLFWISLFISCANMLEFAGARVVILSDSAFRRERIVCLEFCVKGCYFMHEELGASKACDLPSILQGSVLIWWNVICIKLPKSHFGVILLIAGHMWVF